MESYNKKRLLVTAFAFAFFLKILTPCTFVARASAHGTGKVIFVNGGIEAPGDGSSWDKAFRSLKKALDAAQDEDTIWVAKGTYRPTETEDRTASFVLKKGVGVYGGFSGGERTIEERDWRKHKTVLSGDIGRRNYALDNSFHVVTGADRAVLDGFVITGGYSLNALPGARGPVTRGPGMRQQRQGAREGGRPPIHITPEIILRGPSRADGAGMINYQASPIVRNCVFRDNKAKKGGGVYNMVTRAFPPPRSPRFEPLFINCVFEDNFAQVRGGGVANDLGTNPVFLNCIFRNNETREKGGGMYNDFASSPIVINSLFVGNSADTAAAMGNDGGSAPVIYYTTFTGNRALTTGPSVYLGTGPSNDAVVLHSILWGNKCDWGAPGIYAWHDNNPKVMQSIVEGGFPGKGNRASDPGLGPELASALDAGWKPGCTRFSEGSLKSLLALLKPYVRERMPPPPRGAMVPRMPPIPSSDRVVYVDGTKIQPGDGRSWDTAYRSLTAALKDAAGDGARVFVASGTYRPSSGDRSASFELAPGVRLFGGFSGTERSLRERSPEKNPTILSGEIGRAGYRKDNSYHVVVGADGAVINGFTITGGYADGVAFDSHGGGMINYRRTRQGPPRGHRTGFSPEVRNCRFVENYARDGGAVYNYDRGEPRFVNCVFENNRADYGGAVLDRVGVRARYEGCLFKNSRAQWAGGAIYLDYGSRPEFTECAFIGNTVSAGHGGAVFTASRASQLENTVATFRRCRFEKNTAQGDGGAAAFTDHSIAQLEQCEVSVNSSGRNGGGIAVTGGSQVTRTNLQFSGNSARGQGDDVFLDFGPSK
ncbi:MAG: right-handed parallel beta-helix repeat-containing protein [Deltaproteobacteria bacterium]|nr:right-handed parallel beta-helix repeat-containing protein [Deltaproteobacteria bacterium]MBW2138635.1 right-handed parallel beta-helix repeat-containing protein [Deltaproteobacteria bacterium]